MPTLATVTLLEQDRARRVRRFNFRVYLLLWLAVSVYALAEVLSAPSLQQAIDRFVPLLFVAGLAAFAVYLCGRGLRPKSGLRRMSVVPAVLSSLGVFAVGAMVLSAGQPAKPAHHQPAQAESHPAPATTVLVSL